MASRGDLNLNLTPAPEYEEHLKEGLKYAMVQHEILFKHQVRELHRLYWIQKRLMNEVSWRQTVSTSVHEEVPAVDSIEFVSDSADEIVNASTEETRSGLYQYALATGHFKVNFISTEATVNKASDVKVVEYTDKKKAHPKSTASDIPSMEIRMLNESGHRPLEKYAHSENLAEKWRNNKFIDSDTVLLSGLEHGGPQSVNSPTEKQQSKYKLTFIDLNIAQDYDFVNSFANTVEASTSPSTRSTIVINGADLSVSNIYSKGSTSTVQPGFVSPDLRNSRERIANSLHHDLNISYLSSAQTSVQSSNAIDHINYKGVDNEFLTPSIRNPEECCKNSVESIAKANKMGTQHSSDGPILEELHKHGKGHTFSVLDQPTISDSRTMIPVSCSYLENNCLHAPAESTNLPPNTGGLEEKMSRKEESEEDTLSSHAKVAHGEQQDEPESPSVAKINHFECALENRSLANKVVASNSEYSATELDISSNKAQPFEDCEAPFNIEERACHFYRSQSKVYLNQKLAQVVSNDHIVAAAKTLLSLTNQYTMDHLGDRKTESESEESKDQPQSSEDSFETVTLKLKEIRDYGSLVCDKQIDKDGRKVIRGCKLRRGLRDFQKDILPGIISLSRHEICEDLYAIKYELRKNPSSRNSEEACLLPTRSRRSRPYNISRRC
ncbi:uncharacterized protein LOC122050703 isoform X1 [Zingiber officinale]|uniref:uncharacterized protein LOC122050703 isoform X1 n=1 Tax=Zingiber officinale TaxID=94328 RepID=UPI001C4B8F88|nr:uncharacterized protein LOC122050703 isoform X1 [Zingiber officinale]